jgi:antirestriction protein ArdC
LFLEFIMRKFTRSTPAITIDLYAEVTNQIIAALEAGTTPWACPWDREHGSLMPANLTTSRRYRGINVLLLNLRQITAGYPTNRWLTFQQAHSLGAHVRRGESGTRIVFFKLLERDDVPGGLPAGRFHAANDEPPRKVIPLLRSFSVFNEAQVEGLPAHLTWPQAPQPKGDAYAAAEALLTRSGAVIQHGGSRAFYSPSLDLIQMPPVEFFVNFERYYSTALRELTHWTGHPGRCSRTLSNRQHIEAYAFEELVAEMGSAFLSSHCGLQGQLHHASYIASWLQALRNDKRLVFSAASLAQKAMDFLVPELAAAENAEAAA